MQHSEMQGGGMQHAEMQGPGMQGPGMQGGYGPSRSGSGFQPHPDGAGEPPQHHQLEQQVQHQQPHLQQQQMQQQPPLPQQAPPPMPAPGYPRGDGYSVEGKLFLGGLDNATTRQSLLDYVTQWWARRCCTAALDPSGTMHARQPVHPALSGRHCPGGA